jgi:hypothetical protein
MSEIGGERKHKLADLLEKSLEKFKIEERTEVFRINDDGNKTSSVGFLKSEDVAKAFVGIQTDSNWYGTKKRIILTNGEFGFEMGALVNILNDEDVVLSIRKKVSEKLSEEERRILGIE